MPLITMRILNISTCGYLDRVTIWVWVSGMGMGIGMGTTSFSDMCVGSLLIDICSLVTFCEKKKIALFVTPQKDYTPRRSS